MVYLLKVGIFVYRKRGLEYPMPENRPGARDLEEERKHRLSSHTGRHTKKRHTQISLSYEKRPSYCRRMHIAGREKKTMQPASHLLTKIAKYGTLYLVKGINNCRSSLPLLEHSTGKGFLLL
jgi:hypothetical protein